ncbi:hypothetical protein [Streptomyces sp. TLI_185]|uniref:hypothetical protein n=1 Tax=Streptomyces sp. TLI_185 TaxID=2485151 RepID=UPI000F4FBA41|nr:hypothetical protein [Streptomyces sp. TLI_185]
MLLVAGEQVTVDVDLGAVSPAGPAEWGGVLRGVPVRLAAAIRVSSAVRLRFPDGQERQIHPAGQARLDDRGRLLVPFAGEGPMPLD